MRILLVGRRFWPHGSLDSAAHLIQLASDMQRRGTLVEVLTPRYAASWTTELSFREIPIHRPAIAPRSDWSSGRYIRFLTRWMVEKSPRYDLIFVDNAREETIAAVDACRTSTDRNGHCPVVVRMGHSAGQSDLRWWETSRMGKRCENSARSANQIIVSGPTLQRSLISRGFSPQQVCRIDTGINTARRADHAKRIAARTALSAINRDLHAPADEPVAFCVTPMEKSANRIGDPRGDQAIHVMVQSARHLVARYPTLHLWFIGDGSQRDLVYETLRGDGVRASVAMPGSFGIMEDVFAASDVFVQIDASGLDHFLPSAVAAQLPIVAADLPEIRERLSLTATGTDMNKLEPPDDDFPFADSRYANARLADSLVAWFDPQRPKTFRQSMRRVIDDLPTAASNANALHRQLIRECPQSKTIDNYLTVFENVIASHRHTDQGPSMGAVS